MKKDWSEVRSYGVDLHSILETAYGPSSDDEHWGWWGWLERSTKALRVHLRGRERRPNPNRGEPWRFARRGRNPFARPLNQ